MAYVREIVFGGILLFVAALFQNTALLTIAGVKPNVVLVALVLLAFSASHFFVYIVFVIGGIIFLRFSPGSDPALLAIAGIACAVFFVKEWFPWKEMVNCLAVIILGTLAFYLLTGFSFLWHDPFTIAMEIAYNTVIGAAFYPFFRWIFAFRS